MSFGFTAIGDKDEVAEQLSRAQVPVDEKRFNQFGADLRELLIKHFGEETAAAGIGYEYRYVVKATGHGGGSSPLSLNATIEAHWTPVSEPELATAAADEG